MQEYYRTAKKVTQLNAILMLNFGVAFFPDRHPVAININERFQCVRELLDVRDEGVFDRHPSALLECFLILQQRSELKGMTARTLRALWHGRKLINADFRHDPANRALFLRLLKPGGEFAARAAPLGAQANDGARRSRGRGRAIQRVGQQGQQVRVGQGMAHQRAIVTPPGLPRGGAQARVQVAATVGSSQRRHAAGQLGWGGGRRRQKRQQRAHGVRLARRGRHAA